MYYNFQQFCQYSRIYLNYYLFIEMYTYNAYQEIIHGFLYYK